MGSGELFSGGDRMVAKTMSPEEQNGWEQWSKYVLSLLREHNADLKDMPAIRATLDQMFAEIKELKKAVMLEANVRGVIQVDIARMQVRTGIVAGLIGSIPAIIALVYVMIKGSP